MAELIKDHIVLKQGEEPLEILIEVDDNLRAGGLPVHDYGPMRGVESSAEGLFENGMQLIRACAEKVAGTVSAISEKARPDGVSVEFGIKLNGQAGAFFAKTGAESHLKVTLNWSRAKK